MSAAASVPGVLQRRKSCSPPGVAKELREPFVESVLLDVGYAEREEASESGKQESCVSRFEGSASSCTADTLGQKTPYVYDSSAHLSRTASCQLLVAAPLSNDLLKLRGVQLQTRDARAFNHLKVIRPHPECWPGTVPTGEAREPVLCIRCSDSGMALTDFADSSWSPKIAAVLRTSLEGAQTLLQQARHRTSNSSRSVVEHLPYETDGSPSPGLWCQQVGSAGPACS